MHYFKRNIGDYAKKAGRLSMLQHGAYTLLIDACYDREQFPTMEEAVEWTWASTTEEEEAVRFVLRKFFVLEDGRYVQNRIREEIAEYHSKAETNKRIALERETKRRENSTNRAPDVHEAPPNHKPLTNNQDKTPPIPPKGGEHQEAKKSSAVALKTYLANCKTENIKPIPEDDPVFEYAEEAKIPTDFLGLHWREFVDRYRDPDSKRYSNWRLVFRKSVRGNWFRLWYFDAADACHLTTVGIQARNLHEGKVA